MYISLKKLQLPDTGGWSLVIRNQKPETPPERPFSRAGRNQKNELVQKNKRRNNHFNEG